MTKQGQKLQRAAAICWVLFLMCVDTTHVEQTSEHGKVCAEGERVSELNTRCQPPAVENNFKSINRDFSLSLRYVVRLAVL